MEVKNTDLKEAMEQIEKMSKLDSKTLEQKCLKCCEEVGELAQAVLSYTKACGCDYKGLTNKDVVQECADVVIVAMSVMYQAGGTLEDFMKVFHEKMNKWQNVIKVKQTSRLFYVHDSDRCAVARGIRHITCKECGKEDINYTNGIDICPKCAEKLNICRICGEQM
jgi:NTP pyrophosphatase (non-canonical NTP hydrolase)